MEVMDVELMLMMARNGVKDMLLKETDAKAREKMRRLKRKIEDAGTICEDIIGK